MSYSSTYNPRQVTPPKFISQQTVKVPKEVHPSLKAIVVGEEWGPDNTKSKKQSKGWLYWLRFEGVDQWEQFTEEELSAWNGI